MKHAATPLLCLLAAACATTAENAPSEQVRIPLETLQSLTREMSTDAFQGRAPGTEGERMTIELLAREFQRAGLRPGNNGSWYQNVPLVEITAQGSPTLRVTGGRQPLSFNYRRDMVAGSYRVQPRVSFANSDVVFVGYGVNAPERGWNDYAGLDVRGKTVIILVNDPDWQTQGTQGTFGGRSMTYYGRWTYKYEEAARQGAAAAFIVHQTEPASYGWNVVENSWTGPQHHLDRAGGNMDQTVANGWLTNEAARQLFAAAGQDFDSLAASAARPGFRAVPFTGLKASMEIESEIQRQQSRNVIGILPGRTRPNEYLLYTAHWDHLGLCARGRPDEICNGATDNATGTSALVALAQTHARRRPERSIVFIAVTAEESGLLGSRYYAENPVYPLARTVAGINMDSLNMAGATRDFVAIGAGKSQLDGMLMPILERRGVRLSPDPSPEAGYYFRSDQFSFARLGVPFLYGRGGEDLVNGGPAAGRAWSQEYRANRYHQPADEFLTTWDWAGAINDLEIYYELMTRLANGDDWPNWNEGDEFRAIRDRSRSGR
ncbi:M28 family metallopeptidase [Allosphingosinicella sp.]|jgi:Zn-dependent M28 family amino/carboxypeptidase|uniref:M28 family metallopeptidase n=1 Tax=Allosphingosinicella sp. TaxID=2823234 RepID=UPI002F074C84